MSKKGIYTTVFTGGPHFDCQIDGELGGRLEIVQLRTPSFPPSSFWFQTLNFRYLLTKLKEYDVVHGVSPDASFLLTLIKEKLNRPFVVTIHGTPKASQKAFITQPASAWTKSDFAYHVLEFPLHELSFRRVLYGSDHVILCSRTVLAELKDYRNIAFGKISVIYNGVNFDELDRVQPSPQDRRDETTIIYAGRLFWMKGVTFLLDAFKLVRKDFPEVHLKIFGEGPLEKMVRKYIVDSGLQESISYLGFIPHRLLVAEIKRADIVVFPSLYEAQSMFLLEAMACKKPIVTFDLPVMHEIIADERNGLMAKTRNVRDLAQKIGLVLSDKKLRVELGENAYSYVRAKHDIERQADEHIKIYEELCSHQVC
ncbi:glycosyltransferase family 4 protein [Candidatus Bathyarchaeota archaeon]|nr:glycosyltransferase family 4 protein [Candidatus Bathyarchaeota archaeon]